MIYVCMDRAWDRDRYTSLRITYNFLLSKWYLYEPPTTHTRTPNFIIPYTFETLYRLRITHLTTTPLLSLYHRDKKHTGNTIKTKRNHEFVTLTSAMPSRMWRQINGSVWIYSEHVFLFSSFGRGARRTRLCASACHTSSDWLSESRRWSSDTGGQFASREYFSYGYLKSSFNSFGLFRLNGFCLCFSRRSGVGNALTRVSSSLAEFWMLSIHWDTSSVMPQPLWWPAMEMGMLVIAYTLICK